MGLYFLKCTKFDQLILRKIIKIVAKMPDFKAKMHQNRFRLGSGGGKGEAIRHFSFYNLTTAHFHVIAQ